MLRIIRLLSLAIGAFSLGYIAKPTEFKTVFVDVPGPVQYVTPVANRGVEVTTGMRWVNLEAEVPIFQVDNERAMQALAGTDAGFVMGMFTPDNPAIYVLGTWTMECEVSLHEYTHMLEAAMPDQAWRIRRCFHRLCSDKFRIDTLDLMPVLEAPKD